MQHDCTHKDNQWQVCHVYTGEQLQPLDRAASVSRLTDGVDTDLATNGVHGIRISTFTESVVSVY